jgi:hypothetical protein
MFPHCRCRAVFAAARGYAIVAASDTDRSITKQVVFNDIKYDIIVKPFSSGMYQASWRCSACREDGAWAPISADPRNALELALAGLEAHHGFVHGGAKITQAKAR